jgi:hypothetical protein
MKITEILEGKYSGPMEPLTASGKEKSGAVESLERALIKAKKAGTTLNYKNIDAMMQKICKAHNITGQKLHDDFVKANRLIPDNWIKKVDENLANMKNPGIGEYNALTPVMGEDPNENFADGKHPEDKGDSKRYHVPTKGSVSSLRKFAKGHSGRAAQLAHWMANMKSGHKK